MTILAECFNPQDIRGALARAYCSEKNSNKELDATLIEAMVVELASIECAAVKCGAVANEPPTAAATPETHDKYSGVPIYGKIEQ
jgi:hypothetical protein